MKKMKKKGFTLVELLGVIILISLIAIIIVPALTKNISIGTQKVDEQMKENIVLSAKNYFSDNKDNICVELSTLQNEGYIDKNLKNPKDSTIITNKRVVMTKAGSSGKTQYSYEDGDCSEINSNKEIYAVNTNEINKGDSISKTKWCDVETSSGKQHTCFDTESECNNYLSTYSLTDTDTCKESTVIGKTYSSCQATGSNVCLKYKIENNIVTGADICFVKAGNEYCVKGWVDECQSGENSSECTTTSTPVYNSNKAVLQSAFTEANACNENNYSHSTECADSYGFRSLVYSKGFINVNNNYIQCHVGTDGVSYRSDGASCGPTLS